MAVEYNDMRCVDDLDPFGRDAAPLEVLAQDLYHLLITQPGSLVLDPHWGFGLELYLGQPLPSSLTYDIENAVRQDDRVSDAKCTITPVAGEEDSYRLDLKVEVKDEFITIALQLTPGGIVRLS